MLTLSHYDLPSELLQLSKPPLLLHVVGTDLSSLMQRPRLAVVGSRQASPYGRNVTQQLVTELVAKGVVIVSGLAIGIDAIAHQTCLDTGGQTIAVLPCGPEQVYPSIHAGLAREIIEKGGALVTEYDEGTEPYPANFLARNRIIAALSEGIIITEAAERSGSLNAAKHALDLGKLVFVVPGNITSPLSAGCNNLIKAGALMVTSVEDILNAMIWQVIQPEPAQTSLI